MPREDLAASAEGFLTLREGGYLFDAAKSCTGRGVIVEIGSFKGKSTIWLAKGSRAGRGSAVYAVDPHTGSPEERKLYPDKLWTFDEFQKNLQAAGVSDLVVPLVATSEDASRGWNKPIELLWIDGDHRYDMVRTDFTSWSPHVLPGGTVAFHDATNPYFGVAKFLADHVIPSREYSHFGLMDGLMYCRKVAPGSQSAAMHYVWRIRIRMILAGISLLRALPLSGGLKSAIKEGIKRFLGK